MNLVSSMQKAGDDSHMEEKECVACMQKVRLSYFAEILNTTPSGLHDIWRMDNCVKRMVTF